MENTIVREIDRFPRDGLTGRRKITTPVKEITADNVKDVVASAMAEHLQNAAEIKYLWDYYRGKQDIRLKEKFERTSINNKVVVNRANEIVTFKTSYLLNEPIMYVSSGDSSAAKVSRLNEFMRAEDKESKDKEIVDWMHICGVAERLVLTDEMANVKDGAPFYIYTLDPRDAFVIYNAGIGKKPLAGVIIQVDEDNQKVITVYTRNTCFTVRGEVVTEENHILGEIPLVEYVNNEARMGAFECVLSILNNINQLESDAVDSVQDFVNGFDVFQNCDIDDGTYGSLAIGGQAVKVKTVTPGMEAKVYRVASELSQSGVQQRVDDLTNAYLTICGMPNRNGGSSTSDTGQAVIFRDGWSEAESRAKDTEKLFIRSERSFLRIVLNICAAKTEAKLDLELKDLEIDFARKSLNNLQSKFQCMCEGLANSYIDPLDVYNAFGDIFGDKVAAYRRGIAYHEKKTAEDEERLTEDLDRERERINASVSTRGQGNSTTEQGGAAES